MLEKVLHCCTPQVVKKEKEFVLKFVEKKLTINKLSASCLKEEDKVHLDTSIM